MPFAGVKKIVFFRVFCALRSGVASAKSEASEAEMVPAPKKERMNMKKHEIEAMNMMHRETLKWIEQPVCRLFPWTMGSSILGVIAYVDIIEYSPEDLPRLWRVQLRKDGNGVIVFETLDMGEGTEDQWKAIGNQVRPAQAIMQVPFFAEDAA